MKILLRSFAFILMLTFNSVLEAQNNRLEITIKQNVYNLGKYAAVFVDSSARISFERIISPTYQNKFKPALSENLNYGVTPNVVWVKIVLKNQAESTNGDWLLALDYPLIDYVTFYQKNKSNSWTKEETGDLIPYKERRIADRNFIFSPNIPFKKTSTFYLRFQTNGSMQINPKLYRERAFLLESSQSEVAYGLFYGGMLIIIFYNLFLFFSLRDWAYLAYCLSIFVTTFMQAFYSGHVNQYILGNHVYWSNIGIPINMIATPIFMCLFALLFLKTRKFTPFWHKLLLGIIILSCLHLIATFFLPTIQSISIAGIILTFSLFVVIIAGVVSYRRGNKSARFYILAWTVLIITGLMNGFRLFGIIPTNFFTLHAVQFAIWLEAVLLALALADKYNLYRKEKEDTQEKMIKLQEDTNRNLEEKVELRTLELAKTNKKLSISLEKVEEERAKSDNLLLNILPAETAAELKEHGVSTPKQYHLATVLFTDFKNFTQLVEELPPAKIIEVLGICFLAFDEICERNNIEKIKTIGDSYMAAGGLPIANITNPIDAVKAALEMQEWMSNWDQSNYGLENQRWEIRIGIHSGPVMAGVVGKNKFAYDIWGDTVNIASRMESTGAVGKVSISKKTYDLVKDHFDCKYRGKVKAKNIGEIETYWVKGVKLELIRS